MAENLLNVELWHWGAFGVLVVVLLAMDLFVFHRRVHTPTLWESAGWSAFWIALALVFNAFIWWWGWKVNDGNSEAGILFLTGYLVEKLLSVDNLFVFVVVFRFFQVPLRYQYRVLHWGILGAIVLRLAFIVAGVELLERFDWLLPVFGGLLLYTAFKLVVSSGEDVHPEGNILLRLARRFLRVTREDHGQQLVARENGRLCVTPLFLTLLVVESSDVVFAVDSVPAIIGITKDAFIVFTSNIFAILGLRALYFLLAGVIDRFQYLHYGLSLVLFFIGGKMIADYWVPHEGKHLVPPWVSLVVVVVLLIGSILASVAMTRRAEARAQSES